MDRTISTGLERILTQLIKKAYDEVRSQKMCTPQALNIVDHIYEIKRILTDGCGYIIETDDGSSFKVYHLLRDGDEWQVWRSRCTLRLKELSFREFENVMASDIFTDISGIFDVSILERTRPLTSSFFENRFGRAVYIASQTQVEKTFSTFSNTAYF